MAKSGALESLSGLAREPKAKVVATAALVSPLLSGCETKDINTALGYLGFFIVPALLGVLMLKDVVVSLINKNRGQKH